MEQIVDSTGIAPDVAPCPVGGHQDHGVRPESIVIVGGFSSVLVTPSPKDHICVKGPCPAVVLVNVVVCPNQSGLDEDEDEMKMK